MIPILAIHPQNPQPRLVVQVTDCLREGGVIAYPTDSCYALGCALGDKEALDRIRAIRRLDERHNFTLVCRDLSEIATYALVENSAYRFIKALTPGAYTFILRATREVPRRLQHPKRKTIGLRVPDHIITRALLDTLGEPIMSTSLVLPGQELPLTDPYDIAQVLDGRIDIVVDGGPGGLESTTVIDLVEGAPTLLRKGIGDTRWLEH